MEATESPLDVLSRAATMVQDSSPPEYECSGRACATKELPTARWRRERREKAVGGGRLRTQQATPPAAPSDTPLDMTTPRGLPPSYSQSTSRSSRNAPRVSVITPVPRPKDPAAVAAAAVAGANGARREQLCDPVIDEHFRRSLGNEYSSLFDDTARPGSRVTVTGLSVDDHFAKALGETWTKLQRSEPELPSAAAAAAAEATPPAPGAAAEATPSAGAKMLAARRGLVTI